MNPISFFHINNRTVVVPGGGTPITYGTGAGTGTFVQSPTGIWGTGGPIHAVATQTLAISQNGRYQADYLATNNRSAIIGWDSANTNNDFTNWPLGIFVHPATGLFYYVNSGSGVPSAVTAVVGDKYCINRTGGASPVYTAEYYRGSVWTVLFTYTGIAGVNVLLYFKGDIQSTSTYISNPLLT